MPIIRTGTDHKSYSQPALLNDLEMRPRRNANWQTVDIEGFSQKKREISVTVRKFKFLSMLIPQFYTTLHKLAVEAALPKHGPKGDRVMNIYRIEAFLIREWIRNHDF